MAKRRFIIKINYLTPRITAAAVSLAAAVPLGACGLSDVAGILQADGETRELQLDELTGSVSDGGTDAAEGITEEAESPAYSFLVEDADTYAYDHLTATEQIWYTDMEQALGCMTASTPLDESGIREGLDETDVDHIFQCVLLDHPELFYVKGYTYTKYTRGEQTLAVDFEGSYEMDTEQALAREEEIEAAAERFLAEVPDGDDYTRVKYLYEKLIRETDYDQDAADNQNIYSVLVGGASVCQGYAKTMQYLVNRLGIECTLVIGTVTDGERHAWNLIRMDGDYYYVDPTWGDISYQLQETDVGSLPEVSYDYFGVTTAQLRLTHTPENEVELPECTAQADNYFVHEGALFASYDREQMRALVDNSLAQGRQDIALRCTDLNCYNEVLAALVDNQEIFTYLPEGNQAETFAYTLNEQQLSMTFFLVDSD